MSLLTLAVLVVSEKYIVQVLILILTTLPSVVWLK